MLQRQPPWLFSMTIFYLLVNLGGQAQAASLGVSPSGFIVQEIQPGKPYDLYKEAGIRLIINNGDVTSHTYLATAYRPSQRGRWEKGYLEIPDAKWCWFEPSEIVVGPNSKGYANIFLKVPAEEKYFNQRWVVTFGIEGKPGRGGIALAVDVRAQLETQSKAEMGEKPDGSLGLAPSRIRLEDLPAGDTRASSVTLYNNDPTTHTYQVTPLFADQAIRPVSYMTQSFHSFPDRRWLVVDRDRLTIGPQATARLSFTLSAPADPVNMGKRWEDIFLVTPDRGMPGLIRVQVITRNP